MKRAKLLLLMVFVMLTGLDALLMLNQLFHGDMQRASSTSIRILLTGGLLFFVYRGHTWARVVTGLLLFVATIYCGLVAISMQSLLLWTLLPLFAFGAYVVLLSPSVRAFLVEQKAKRTFTNPEVPAEN